MNDKFQILRDFANSNDKPDKDIYQFVKEVLDMNSAYAKENQQLKEQSEHLDIVNCRLRKNIEEIESENQKLKESFDKYKKRITPIKMLQRLDVLEEENQQLKIQISAREKEYKKLEDNWNKLKEYVKEEIILQFYNDKLPFEIIVENVLNKMKELERGVSDDSN